MNHKLRIASIATAAILVVGGGVSLFAANRAPARPVTVPATHFASMSPSHPLSLVKRERILSPEQSKKYHVIPVITEQGRHTTLDVSNHPVVFLSDWDTTILNQFAGQKFSAEPTLVVTWPSQKETLTEALGKVVLAAKKLHLTNPVVALNSTKPMQWVSGLPDTYVSSKSKVMEVPGPLPASEVNQWAKVFK